YEAGSGNFDIESDTTLYAKWTVNTYKVTFDLDEGILEITNQIKQYDSTYGKSEDGTTDETLPIPSKMGYTFEGWYDDNKIEITDISNVETASNHILYAKWINNIYEVTFDPAGGIVKPKNQMKLYDYVYGKSSDGLTDELLPIPMRSGYTFEGWYVNNDGKENRVTNKIYLKIASDHKLYAKWVAVEEIKKEKEPKEELKEETKEEPKEKITGVDILVNGKIETAATAKTETVDNKTTTTIQVNDALVEKKLKSEGLNSIVTITVKEKSNVVVGSLNGKTVKDMEDKSAVLEVVTESAKYTLPALQINIDDVSKEMGNDIKLKDIKVNVIINDPSNDDVKIIEDTANKNKYNIIVKPVEFEITCTNNEKTVNVSKFNGYVERMVAIPEGIDPSKITTGIVLNKDGTFSHVPTTVSLIEGKYYAKINSLTNSIYSVIYSPMEFNDMEGHWAKTYVNDMASRLIVKGNGNGYYLPDDSITRAEFAAVIVNALGLMRSNKGKNVFEDVKSDKWYYNAISIANEYGLISGYKNGLFKPTNKITREEGMLMIARAMKIANFDISLNENDITNELKKYSDYNDISDWGRDAIAKCIKAEIVTGYKNNLILSKSDISRAEVATMIWKMLKKSGLI
ncbi:MAG: S-layer homology domain-containing protein, partial [Clostridiales bacterium]